MKLEGILKTLKRIGIPDGDFRVGTKDVWIKCPLAPWTHAHRIDTSPSLGIKIDSTGPSVVHCFGCGFKGVLGSLVRAVGDHDESRDYEGLARVVDEEELYSYDWETQFEKSRTRADVVLSNEAVIKWSGTVHRYMDQRNFLESTLTCWQIGWDSFRRTIVLPVRTQDHCLVGAVGRFVDYGNNPNVKTKYYNYWKFKKSRYLVGEHLIRPRTTVVVVEGALDAPKLWQLLNHHGMLNRFSVVSTLGSEISYYQAQRLVSMADTCILMFDNDKAGHTATARLKGYLREQMLVLLAEYPSQYDGEDPDSLVDKDPVTVLKMLDNPKFLF